MWANCRPMAEGLTAPARALEGGAAARDQPVRRRPALIRDRTRISGPVRLVAECAGSAHPPRRELAGPQQTVAQSAERARARWSRLTNPAGGLAAGRFIAGAATADGAQLAEQPSLG